MPLSLATVAVLGLSGEDASRLDVAQQAPTLAGYLDRMPIGAFWDSGSAAVRMLNDLVL
jgi:hypothetical protein